MRELEELALGAEVVVERLREDERVGDQRAARVVADEQHRPARRDVLQPAHIGAEPDVRHHAQRGERARDVLGVTQRERVGGRRPAREMARVGGVGDVDRYGAKHPRVRRDRAEHSAHPAATAIAHDHRKHATLCRPVRGLFARWRLLDGVDEGAHRRDRVLLTGLDRAETSSDSSVVLSTIGIGTSVTRCDAIGFPAS